MEQYKVLQNLLDNHYKQFIVTSAIAPYTEYTQYTAELPVLLQTEVVCAFGKWSGKKISTDVAVPINTAKGKYYAHQDDVFIMSRPYYRPHTEQVDPQDFLLVIDADNTLLHHSDLILTVYNTYQLKDECTKLSHWHYDDDSYAHENNVIVDYCLDEYILEEDARRAACDGNYYHYETEELIYSDTLDYYVHTDSDNVCYAEDIQEWILTDDAYYNEDNNKWNHERGNSRSRNVIQEYHCGLAPNFYTKPIDKNVPLSQYAIGFEVEKSSVNNYNDAGYHIEDQPLFSHWETDSSCGVEGITNVYSLDNAFAFISDTNSSSYTDEETNQNCGGHINISHRNNRMEYWHIRPWLGLIYSMWKKRLRNQYSRCNKKLNPYAGKSAHYSVLVEKGAGDNRRFELRLPNRVRTADTLITRFTLMQEVFTCVDMYINEDFTYTQSKFDDLLKGLPNWAFTDDMTDSTVELYKDVIPNISQQTYQRTRFLIEACRDLLQDCYLPEKLTVIIAHAYLFQHYIDVDDNHEHLVRKYLGEYINN